MGPLLREIRTELLHDLFERLDELEGCELTLPADAEGKAQVVWLHTDDQIREWLADIIKELEGGASD